MKPEFQSLTNFCFKLNNNIRIRTLEKVMKTVLEVDSISGLNVNTVE